MASKYAALRSKLLAFEPEQEWQQKVEAWKSEHCGENPEDANVAKLAEEFRNYKQTKDELEERIGICNIALEALSQLLIARLESESQDSVRLSSGATVYLQYEVYPSVADEEALLGWLKQKKMTASLRLPWQTLKALCSELAFEGKAFPSGVKTFLKSHARVRDNGG